MRNLGSWLFDLALLYHFDVYVDKDTEPVRTTPETWGTISVIEYYRGKGRYQ
jgi:hypothetical protein